jgi:hypothetical protein
MLTLVCRAGFRPSREEGLAMNSLFGVSMNTIMVVILGIFLVITAVVVGLAIANKLFFKMGCAISPAAAPKPFW